MKLEMRHWLVGDQPNGTPWPSTGGVVDLDDDELVEQLLASGAAVRVDEAVAADIAADDGDVDADLTAGSVADVTARVGSDEVLAQAVLDQERAKPKPRKGVIEQLEAVLAEDRCGE